MARASALTLDAVRMIYRAHSSSGRTVVEVVNGLRNASARKLDGLCAADHVRRSPIRDVVILDGQLQCLN